MNKDRFEHDLLEIAIRESLAGRIASSAALVWSRAWPSSGLGRVLAAIAEVWQGLSSAQRIRAGGIAGAVAMTVDRVMALTVPAEPLSAVLPSIVLAVCVAVAVFAAPIARTSEQLRR